MVIQVNDKHRISSDRNSWTVQKYVGKRKDGKDEWENLYYCVDFGGALASLGEYLVRTIPDTAAVSEITVTLKEIVADCKRAANLFELPPLSSGAYRGAEIFSFMDWSTK